MPKYLIEKSYVETFRYAKTMEVEAPTRELAKQMANRNEGVWSEQEQERIGISAPEFSVIKLIEEADK